MTACFRLQERLYKCDALYDCERCETSSHGASCLHWRCQLEAFSVRVFQPRPAVAVDINGRNAHQGARRITPEH